MFEYVRFSKVFKICSKGDKKCLKISVRNEMFEILVSKVLKVLYFFEKINIFLICEVIIVISSIFIR